MNGHACPPIPQNRSFPLVGDAEGCDVPRPQPGLLQRTLRDAQLSVPNLRGVMFHPARLRIKLFDLLLRDRANPTLTVEKNGSGAGCTFVKSEDVGHGDLPSRSVIGSCGGAVSRPVYPNRHAPSPDFVPPASAFRFPLSAFRFPLCPVSWFHRGMSPDSS